MMLKIKCSLVCEENYFYYCNNFSYNSIYFASHKGHDKFEVFAKKFQVNNIHGGTLMQINKDLMEINSNSLKIEGDGIVFR